MSVKFSGTFKRSAGILSAIGKQIRLLNLKAVKRVTVTFDPFHENATAARDFLSFLSHPSVAQTNANCLLKADVICNREAPTIHFTLIPAVQDSSKLKNIKFNGSYLTALELLQLTNRHVSALAPPEDVVNVVKTKSEKKAGAANTGRGGGKRK